MSIPLNYGSINSKAINAKVPINGTQITTQDVIWTNLYDGAEYLDSTISIYLSANDGVYDPVTVPHGPIELCARARPLPMCVAGTNRTMIMPCENRTMHTPPFVREK